MVPGGELGAQGDEPERSCGVASDRLQLLEFSAEAAAHYGQVRASLKRVGTPIGFHDMLIGAHARSENMTLVTNNRREFDRIPGLRIENWV